MATIKIQKNQTLGEIARLNNTSIADLMKLNPQIKDANLVYYGQQITLPNSTKLSAKTNLLGTANSTPVLNTKIQPFVLTAENMKSPVDVSPAPNTLDLNVISNKVIPEVPSTFTPSTFDATYNAAVGTNANTPTTGTATINNLDVANTTELSEIDKILNQKNSLQSEVAALEDKIINRSKTREDALAAGGVYDDIKALNDLKTKQQTLEEEARLYLVGKGGTTSGLSSLTNLESRQAALRETQLTNRINTTLNILDQKLKAENDTIDLLYAQKTKLLDSVSKSYVDILTEQEKINLEDRKFQQQLYLEQVKANNSLLSERAKTALDIASKEGKYLSEEEFNGILNGDANVINRVYGNTAKSNEIRLGAEGKVNLIDKLLNNETGLASSVGVNALGRSTLGSVLAYTGAGAGAGAALGSIIPGVGTAIGGLVGGAGAGIGQAFQAKGKKNIFSNDLGQLASQESLDYYTKIKAKGATFGALTEKEQEWLTKASAAGGLGILTKTDKDGNSTYTSNLTEEAFKEALINLRSATQKTIIAEELIRQGKDTSALRNMSSETLNSLYKQIQATPVTEGDAYNTYINGGNIPQRNNNPGNIKTTGTSTGGVAAQYALKNADGTPMTDKYKHLIFPTPEDGIRGLVADLTAKINGGSSVVPKNPTLAQLGKVYAEDGNWTRGVSSILGVPANTLVAQIPIKHLVVAIAKQEGYYA